VTVDDAFHRHRGSSDLFGVPLDLPPSEADELFRGLQTILQAQFVAAHKDSGLNALWIDSWPPTVTQLSIFTIWFDPTAKGDRIRSEIARLPSTDARFAHVSPVLVIDVGDDRHLVTPEGWLVARSLARAESRARQDEERMASVPIRRRISESDADASLNALVETYRTWTRRRITDVVGLLTSETSTLRPAAAGLLFTLLVNRNTAPERALRRPTDPRQLAIVAEAIAAPALAYAEGLSGRRNSFGSVDLDRGWALGELRRRLGPGFHTGRDEGIWLNEKATEDAVRRLVDDIQRRSGSTRTRIPDAVSAALAAYDARRPELAGLELAFERPANTRRLAEALLHAAEDSQQSPPRRGRAVLGDMNS
jgi:hypothetical protein